MRCRKRWFTTRLNSSISTSFRFTIQSIYRIAQARFGLKIYQTGPSSKPVRICLLMTSGQYLPFNSTIMLFFKLWTKHTRPHYLIYCRKIEGRESVPQRAITLRSRPFPLTDAIFCWKNRMARPKLLAPIVSSLLI